MPSAVARLAALARASSAVAEDGGLRALKRRAGFIAEGLRHASAVDSLLEPRGAALTRLMRERPNTIGVVSWPFITSTWGIEERIRRHVAHCAEIDRLGAPFAFGVEEKLVLLDLGAVHPGLAVVLDQPKWFMREGLLTLNLFVGDLRAMSLAFAFVRGADGALEAVVGALQGRNLDDALDLFRALTKALHTMRPRDFLFETFAIICGAVGVARVFAVADDCRHQRHPFLGKKDAFTTSYDEIWTDRGGRRIGAEFFALDVVRERRSLSEVKQNKRAAYRRRYEFLDDCAERLGVNLPGARPVMFEAK